MRSSPVGALSVVILEHASGHALRAGERPRAPGGSGGQPRQACTRGSRRPRTRTCPLRRTSQEQGRALRELPSLGEGSLRPQPRVRHQRRGQTRLFPSRRASSRACPALPCPTHARPPAFHSFANASGGRRLAQDGRKGAWTIKRYERGRPCSVHRPKRWSHGGEVGARVAGGVPPRTAASTAGISERVVGQSSVKPPVQASPSRSPTRPADTGHIEHQILNLGDHVLSGLLGDDFGATALQRVPAARAQRFRPGEHQRRLSSPRVGDPALWTGRGCRGWRGALRPLSPTYYSTSPPTTGQSRTIYRWAGSLR